MSISAKFLTCFVAGTEVTGTHEYDVNEVGDRLEATTAAHAGRGKKDVGVIDTRMRVVLYVDAVTADLTPIRVGTELTNLEFFTDDPGTGISPVYLIDSATVFESRFRGQIRDRFIYECDIEANGDVVTMNALA